MSQYVNENVAIEFAQTGTLIGKTEPSRETKWTWWEVYTKDDRIVACVVDEENGIICGEEISRQELPGYVDDIENALETLVEA